MTRYAELPIPERIDGVSPDWLIAACDAAWPGSGAVPRIVQVIEGTCTKIRVAIATSDPAVPCSMMIKGGFADHSHQFLGMHLTEMRFYRDIAGLSVLDTPACHLAAHDPESGRAIVLLEDLDSRDVRWLSALSPLGWRDESAFVDRLAAFAGQYWLSDALAPGGRLDWVIHSYEREAADYIAHYLEPSVWSRFLALPRCACLPRRFHDRERMRAALDRLAERLDTQAMTLSHGDTHLGNLYLDRDGTPGFLDAQPRRAPWVKDFAYHLVAALDIEDRRRWERPLLARYLRRLGGAGVIEVPVFEEAWHEFRCEIAYGLFIFMINEGRFQREEINTAYAARFGAAAIDHGTFALLG